MNSNILHLSLKTSIPKHFREPLRTNRILQSALVQQKSKKTKIMTGVLSGDVIPSENIHKVPKSSLDIPSNPIDIEKNTSLSPQSPDDVLENDHRKTSLFKSLGWLDCLLALWIFSAMAFGIILGNFVPNTAHALQKGTFVGVSVPIGWYPFPLSILLFACRGGSLHGNGYRYEHWLGRKG